MGGGLRAQHCRVVDGVVLAVVGGLVGGGRLGRAQMVGSVEGGQG